MVLVVRAASNRRRALRATAQVLVIFGALVYVLGGVCAFYGAIAFACMELTNLFFVPRVLAETVGWQMDGPLCTVNGVCLVVTFVVFRVGVCTGMAVLFTVDLAGFSSPYPTEWALVLCAYTIFMAVLVLSWVWLRRVLQELRDGVQVLLHQRRALKAQRAASAKKLTDLEGQAAPSAAAAGSGGELPAGGHTSLSCSAVEPSPAVVSPPQLDASIDAYCASRGDDQAAAASSSSSSSSSKPPQGLPMLSVASNPLGAVPQQSPAVRSGRAVQLDPLPAAGVEVVQPPRKGKLLPGRGATVAPECEMIRAAPAVRGGRCVRRQEVVTRVGCIPSGTPLRCRPVADRNRESAWKK